MGAVINDNPSRVAAELVTQVNKLVTDVTALQASLTAAQADIATIRTATSGHTHGGITAGAGTSGAMTAIGALTSSAPAALTVSAITLYK